MSFKETDVKELASQDHEVLGSDFCSGYTDTFGKWNTGFNCPRMGNGETVYCCGTVTYKYCCTRRDQHTSSGISQQSVIIGSVLGAVMLVIFVTIVSCLICRRGVPFRRAHPSMNGGPLYTMHCSSTASGMANLYSFSGQTTATTTPLDTPHVLVDFDNPEHHIYAQPLNGHRGISRHLTRAEGCGTPSDPPPPYNEQNPRAEAGQNSFAMQSSSSNQRAPSNQNRRHSDYDTPTQNRQYWSTKF